MGPSTKLAKPMKASKAPPPPPSASPNEKHKAGDTAKGNADPEKNLDQDGNDKSAED
jgi:hypothetical protein